MIARMPVLAASVAVFRDGEVLLAQRANAPAKGLWTLPGGRVEAGETLAACALRELMEEVGINARIAGFVNHVEMIEHHQDGQLAVHVVICAFAAHWVSGEGHIGDEVTAIRWCDIEMVHDMPHTNGLMGVLALARNAVEGA